MHKYKFWKFSLHIILYENMLLSDFCMIPKYKNFKIIYYFKIKNIILDKIIDFINWTF